MRQHTYIQRPVLAIHTRAHTHMHSVIAQSLIQFVLAPVLATVLVGSVGGVVGMARARVVLMWTSSCIVCASGKPAIAARLLIGTGVEG